MRRLGRGSPHPRVGGSLQEGPRAGQASPALVASNPSTPSLNLWEGLRLEGTERISGPSSCGTLGFPFSFQGGGGRQDVGSHDQEER